MALLPANLSPNIISIYGYHSLNNIRAGNQYQFGVVNQMYFGAQEDLTGQSVLFNTEKAFQVNYNNTPYFLIQQEDIILTENELS